MFFTGKNVLILGGTGTIGRSLMELVSRDEPNMIRIFSRDEYKQFLYRNELGKRPNVTFMLGDVRDYDRVLAAMEQIDYVFHVAALKRVSSCEENPYEAVMTNVIGTQHVIKAAYAKQVKKVVFTSTDKAISPTNAYGATKLLAERLVAGTYTKHRARTAPTIAIVRFGNVLGSRGSVIPIFINQILSNVPITVTDPKMSRFMMTLSQAAHLTVHAMRISAGGEVFVLKMPVIRIGDLVQAVVEQTCWTHGIDPATVQVMEIGAKPGEKQYEELMTEEESEYALETDKMFIIPPYNDRGRLYPNATKAKKGAYGSDRAQAIGIKQIKELLDQEKLL